MRFRRRRHESEQLEQPPGVPGVPYGASTTYVMPDFQPQPGRPAAREPGLRLRVVPNESLLPHDLGRQLGELTQALIDEGAEVGISVEIDTSDRTRPGEHRGGASPIEAIALILLGTATGYTARQIERLGDRMFDATVSWVLRHRQVPRAGDEPVAVKLFGPDGEVIKRVLVPEGHEDVPPYVPEAVRPEQ
jgi:hypothetical protein